MSAPDGLLPLLVAGLAAADSASRECVSAAVRHAIERLARDEGSANVAARAHGAQGGLRRRRAFATLLSTESYARGVVALRRSLVELESAYPLLVIAGDAVPASTLRELEARAESAGRENTAPRPQRR